MWPFDNIPNLRNHQRYVTWKHAKITFIRVVSKHYRWGNIEWSGTLCEWSYNTRSMRESAIDYWLVGFKGLILCLANGYTFWKPGKWLIASYIPFNIGVSSPYWEAICSTTECSAILGCCIPISSSSSKSHIHLVEKVRQFTKTAFDKIFRAPF